MSDVVSRTFVGWVVTAIVVLRRCVVTTAAMRSHHLNAGTRPVVAVCKKSCIRGTLLHAGSAHGWRSADIPRNQAHYPDRMLLLYATVSAAPVSASTTVTITSGYAFLITCPAVSAASLLSKDRFS